MPEQFYIREVKPEDAGTFHKFAVSTAVGMISLPRKKELMDQKIEHALKCFSNKVKKPKNELYLFALENRQTKKVGGSSGIYSRSGVDFPYFFYRVKSFKEKREITLLTPHTESNGPSELCALYIIPKWRKLGLGKLLSFSRLLYIASNPHLFDTVLTARLRGVIHKQKKSSPFWDGLGKPLLGVDFGEATRLIMDETDFLPEFMHRTPIIANLLPQAAQNVIGVPHSTTQPAMDMLMREGFQKTFDVDFFDAGPTLMAKTKEIKTIVNSRAAIVEEVINKTYTSSPNIISSNKLEFRACLGKVLIKANRAVLTKDTADLLQVEKGDKIRYV